MNLEAPPPLEEAAAQTKQRVVPAKHEAKAKITPQPVRPAALDEKSAPWNAEEKAIEFKPSSAPKAQPILAPAPLPQIESTPIPATKPVNIGLLPAPPSNDRTQAGTGGFVTMETLPIVASAGGPDPRTAVPLSTLAPTVFRAAIGTPHVVEFTPPSRR